MSEYTAKSEGAGVKRDSKSTICRFPDYKCANVPSNRRLQVQNLTQKQQLFDFQIVNKRKRRQIRGSRCKASRKIHNWSISKFVNERKCRHIGGCKCKVFLKIDQRMSENAAKSEVVGVKPIKKSAIGQFSNCQ